MRLLVASFLVMNHDWFLVCVWQKLLSPIVRHKIVSNKIFLFGILISYVTGLQNFLRMTLH